jgi:hypothetical protein
MQGMVEPMDRRKDNGEMMVMMFTEKANTVVRRLREVDADTPGKVMVRMRDHSLARRVVSSRGLRARTTGREVATVAIVVAVVVDGVVVVVGFASRPQHRSWLTRPLRIWLLILCSRLSCLARRWRL